MGQFDNALILQFDNLKMRKCTLMKISFETNIAFFASLQAILRDCPFYHPTHNS